MVKQISGKIDKAALNSALDYVESLIKDSEHSSGYFKQHRMRFAMVVKKIIPVIESLAHKDVIKLIDVGSHELHLSLIIRHIFPNIQIMGVDVEYFTHNPVIKKLADDHNIELFDCDFIKSNELPLPSESTDIVLFFETLEHLNIHPLPVVQELSRIVAKGGYLFLTTPNQLSIGFLKHFIVRQSIHQDLRIPYSIATHYRTYTIDELVFLIKSVGLEFFHKAYLEFPLTYLPGLAIYLRLLIAFFIRPWSNNMIVIGQKK